MKLHGRVDHLKLTVTKIETLIENSQHYAPQGIPDILKLPKSMNLLVKMKNVSFILWKKLNGQFGQPTTIRKGECLYPV